MPLGQTTGACAHDSFAKCRLHRAVTTYVVAMRKFSRRSRPTREQYQQLIDKLAEAGVVEWLSGPAGPKQFWRFAQSVVENSRREHLIETLRGLDQGEQRIFSQLLAVADSDADDESMSLERARGCAI